MLWSEKNIEPPRGMSYIEYISRNKGVGRAIFDGDFGVKSENNLKTFEQRPIV